MEEVNMTELGVTVTMLQTICEAIESAEFDEDVSLDDLGYGPLTVSQLNVLLLEASGPNSLEYEEICGTPLNLQVMELLLERGADMECSDGEGSTPLYRSVLHDQIREMQFLLEKGARTDALFYVPHDEAGESCLSTAIQLGNHDMVILLLKYGANLRSPPGILFFAAADSDVDMVRLLIDAGEDVLQMNPATELSLCDTAFAMAVGFEQELHLHLSDQSRSSDLRLSRELFHLSVENCLKQHRKKMELIKYLVQKGCHVPSCRQLRHAVERHAFHTLIEIYTICLNLKKKLRWPEFLESPTDLHFSKWNFAAAIDILTGMVRRTRTSGGGNSEGKLLKHLNGICGFDRNDDSVPRLADLSIDAIRQSLGRNKMEFSYQDVDVDELLLPQTIKNMITLSDLQEEFQFVQNKMRKNLFEL